MDNTEYTNQSSKTLTPSEELGINVDNKTIDLLHCAIGAVTESGELLDAFKKHIYYKKELDIANISEEIGDIQFYLFNLCRLLGINIEDVYDTNIAKLKARYGDKFTTDKANNRDLKTERKILENGVVVSESRDLETGGMKPPKNNWTSYAKDVDISESEKERMKAELRKKLSKNLGLEEVVVKDDGSLKLKDVAAAFGHLENYDGSLVVKVISSEEEIKDTAKTILVDLSSYLNKIKKVGTIALSVYDFISNAQSHTTRFVVLISFDQMTGVLKFDKAIGPNNQILSLGGKQLEELNNFLSINGIDK